MRALQTTRKPTVVQADTPETPRPLSSGVVLLSSNLDLLYVTSDASRVLRDLGESEQEAGSSLHLPSSVCALCTDLESSRRQCASPREWAGIRHARTASTMHDSILLRGFLMPEWSSPQCYRLLIILEMLESAVRPPAETAEYHHLLTARQEAVARGLVRGLTNKEVAQELSISAHTVKEYVRAIMSKMRATTRAGAVARLVGLAPPSEGPLSQHSQSNRHSDSHR